MEVEARHKRIAAALLFFESMGEDEFIWLSEVYFASLLLESST